MSTRLLEAIVDIQHWLKHDIDEPCGSCIRFDELQLAAMELIKTSEARIAELEAENQRLRTSLADIGLKMIDILSGKRGGGK